MSEEILIHTLAVAGTALYVVRAVPSTVQAIRTRAVGEGDALGIDLLTISGIWWVIYALEIDNVPTLIAALAGLVPGVVTLAILARGGRLHGGVAALLAAGLALVPLALFSSRLAGVTAAALGALIAVPQAVSLLRAPRQAAAAPSLLTWALVGFNAVVWLVYGILIQHPVLGAAGLIQLPCAAVICWQELRRRAQLTPPGSRPAPHAG